MLTVNTSDMNLGHLKFGIPHSFDFIISNNYDIPIDIERISLGCSACTKATMDQPSIAPKSKAPLHVIFTPGSLGMQSKTLSLLTSSKGVMLPNLEMRFRSTVS